MLAILIITFLGAALISYLGFASARSGRPKTKPRVSRSDEAARTNVMRDRGVNAGNPEAMKMAEGGTTNNSGLMANHSG